MPLGYGGGISSIDQIKKLFSLGIEKVIFNNASIENIDLLKEAALLAGSSSIVASIDVKKDWKGSYYVFTKNGTNNTKINPEKYVKKLEESGVGEILLNSIDRDGTLEGYDLNIISKISKLVNIPVVCSGGANSISDFSDAIKSGASAVSAGSFFVLHGKHRAVLITYPKYNDLERLLK